MNTTLRQLETLHLFALTRSITETARLMGVSQPAVSQTLKELEGHFGFPVYVSINRRPRLTPEVLQILPEVARILSNFSALSGRVGEMRDTKAGALSIISPATAMGELIPLALADFRRERPNVRCSLDVGIGPEINRKLREEAVDVGINFLPTGEPSLAAEPLLRTNMVCVIPPGHRLARTTGPITPKDLIDEIVAVVRLDGPSAPLATSLTAAREGRVEPISTNQPAVALNLVRHGLAIAVIQPMALSRTDLNTLCVRPFEPRIELTWGLLYSRRRPMARTLAKFFSSIRNATQDMAGNLREHGIEMEVLL